MDDVAGESERNLFPECAGLCVNTKHGELASQTICVMEITLSLALHRHSAAMMLELCRPQTRARNTNTAMSLAQHRTRSMYFPVASYCAA